MRTHVVLASVFLLLSSGCRNESTAVDAKSESSPATTTAAGSNDHDLIFIDAMTRHHQGAVEMARLAESRAADAKVKAFAKRVITEQEKEIAQLRAWRGQWYSGAPVADVSKVAGASSMKMDMSHMQGLSGEAFDTMFVDMMVPHHEGAVTMSCEVHAKGGRPEILQFARNVIKAQEREISELERWKKGSGK